MKLTQRLIWIMAAASCILSAQDDPPGRVARLSYVYGSVSFLPAGENDWAPADFNRPLTTGDHIFVDFAGTGELQAGSAVLRLGSQTALEILNLDDSNAQLRLTEGTLVVRVRFLGDQDSFEVDTPNLAFSLQRPGEYRIDVKPDSATTIVTVRAGEGELTGPDQAFTVNPGEQVQVAGDDRPSYRTLGAPPRDTLENFCAQRDRRDDDSPSARYVSRQLVGYQDLDKYGSWRDTPDYGAVWVPNATPDGWAPYHYGHWLWVDPWGWTWVDDAPWGFAPFHYGRWAYVGNYWGWVPGPVSGASRLCACVGRLGRWRRDWGRSGLVCAWTARSLSPDLSHQFGLREPRERHEHCDREQHQHHQYRHNQCELSKPYGAWRSNGGAARRVCQCQTSPKRTIGCSP